MKHQAIQYLALDNHKATTTGSVRDESGEVRLRMTLRTTAGDLLSAVRAAGERVHVAFEEGTQAQWVHDLLEPHVGDLRSVFHRVREMRTLRELVRNYLTLVQDTTRLMLRIKALFRARAIPCSGIRFTAGITVPNGSASSASAACGCVPSRFT